MPSARGNGGRAPICSIQKRSGVRRAGRMAWAFTRALASKGMGLKRSDCHDHESS